MKKFDKDEKAGLYTTVIVHLAVLIALLVAGLDFTLKKENTFVLDFSEIEKKERMMAEIENLRREAEMQQAIAERIQKEIGSAPAVRNVAVDRSALKDDRGTDAEQLYKDAERLQQELNKGYSVPDEDHAAINQEKKEQPKKKEASYSGPSVVSYMLEGRKASRLSIPAYRCLGEGEVTVLIAVDNAGNVVLAKVDESVSSTDGCLRAFAIRAARLSKFSADANAPARQEGNIVYKFIAQ